MSMLTIYKNHNSELTKTSEENPWVTILRTGYVRNNVINVETCYEMHQNLYQLIHANMMNIVNTMKDCYNIYSDLLLYDDLGKGFEGKHEMEEELMKKSKKMSEFIKIFKNGINERGSGLIYKDIKFIENELDQLIPEHLQDLDLEGIYNTYEVRWSLALKEIEKYNDILETSQMSLTNKQMGVESGGLLTWIGKIFTIRDKKSEKRNRKMIKNEQTTKTTKKQAIKHTPRVTIAKPLSLPKTTSSPKYLDAICGNSLKVTHYDRPDGCTITYESAIMGDVLHESILHMRVGK